ncbi:MAG: transposase [Lewinella sp.]|nr:transposase [Lewinella sp.]
MFKTLLQNNSSSPIQQKAGSFLLHQVGRYTDPLLEALDAQIDKRLVDTFFNLFVTILMFRNRAMGLLLTELGGYICGFDRAPAGTKRISNLLRSKKWSASLIDDYFFRRTVDRIAQLREQGKRALMLWDDSRVEKHESWMAEGLCSVFSSKGQRLTRIRRGFFTPPKGRICVPGFQWTGVFLSHLGGVPSVCQMSWWTTRGKFKEDPDNIIYRLLRKIHQYIGSVVHVLDRGYANEKMLRYLFHFKQDFIIRWKKNHLLNHHDKGCKKTHLLARSFRGRKSKIVRDKARDKNKHVTIDWAAVNHPEYPDNQLYLIIVRDKRNYNGPMYIITSLPIENAAQAWEVLFSYMHRWEAEQGFRFLKSEMGLECPRLWFWDNRMKLMAIVALVYDFILRTLRNWKSWVQLFFRNWCHRTGKRYREASIPLYRLRMAISNCLFTMWAQNSG